METLRIDPERPAESLVERAASVIAAGGLVAFPTETFYGLGADPWNDAALDALFLVKGRHAHSPILLLLASEAQAALVARSLPPPFGILTRSFWPGPLTLVVPARVDLPVRLTAGGGTIGLRVPGSAIARAIAASLGRPITGTSANHSGTAPARTAAQLQAALLAIDLLIDGGETAGGLPSTVVDVTGGEPRLVRAGAIPFEQILLVARQP